ncbi:MAG: low molecular weight protein-tyrosine-phosphatase [Marmoricola sp.]
MLPAPTGTPYRIGIVCLGNICRSPMADVILTRLVDDAGLSSKVEVVSSGTGTWHLGEPMDPRAARRLEAEGYDASAHRAQKFDATWHSKDLVLAMDANNLADITDGRGASERVRMFRSFDPLVEGSTDPADLDVPDPFYGGDEGFVEVIAMVERTCRRILVELEALGL